MISLPFSKKYNQRIMVFLFFMVSYLSVSQVPPGVYLHKTVSKGTRTIHQVKLTQDYFIYTVYEENPVKFVKSIGGFYSVDTDKIMADLEFNSDYEIDSLKTWVILFSIKNENLILELDTNTVFKKAPELEQALDATWLFATRGPDTGQDRRGEESARKTLKFLKDGTFQWIAYDTDTMKFSGTGGGNFTSSNGVYTENIEFFSRDNARVGATLKFNYELKDDDWYHTGKNSKGEPMFEIWSRRNK